MASARDFSLLASTFSLVRYRDLVRQQSDAHGVGVRAVVAEDRLVVAVDEEEAALVRGRATPRWSAAAGRARRAAGRRASPHSAERPGTVISRIARHPLVRIGTSRSMRASAAARDRHLAAPALVRPSSRSLAGSWPSRRRRPGADVQMFGRPSPSKSTACLRKLDGMNCGWPIAPAHDPFRSPARPAAVDDRQRVEAARAGRARGGRRRRASRARGSSDTCR